MRPAVAIKLAKAVLGLLLLPVCVGTTNALIRVLDATSGSNTVWVGTAAGAACWFVIYLLLPKPMLIYVFGHELTHVLWAWGFGGRVKKFKATARGGRVVVTKSNFLVALAPYFFPVYAIMIGAVLGLGQAVWDWSRLAVYFYLLIGAAYAFHVTLTLHVLRSPQSDLTDHGYLFSLVVIWLGNLLVLLIGVSLLTAKVDFLLAVQWSWAETVRILHQVRSIL